MSGMQDGAGCVELDGLDELWFQVAGTRCNLTCTHCFISCGPQNHTHEMMSLQQVRQRLEESKQLGVKDYYITGGEVFMNQEIFEINDFALFSMVSFESFEEHFNNY